MAACMYAFWSATEWLESHENSVSQIGLPNCTNPWQAARLRCPRCTRGATAGRSCTSAPRCNRPCTRCTPRGSPSDTCTGRSPSARCTATTSPRAAAEVDAGRHDRDAQRRRLGLDARASRPPPAAPSGSPAMLKFGSLNPSRYFEPAGMDWPSEPPPQIIGTNSMPGHRRPGGLIGPVVPPRDRRAKRPSARTPPTAPRSTRCLACRRVPRGRAASARGDRRVAWPASSTPREAASAAGGRSAAGRSNRTRRPRRPSDEEPRESHDASHETRSRERPVPAQNSAKRRCGPCHRMCAAGACQAPGER